MQQRILVDVKSAGVSYRQRIGLLKYNTFWGLKDVSFQLRAGETLGIIGDNGAGKSTLLRLVSGIIDPNKGSIWREPSARFSLLALNAGFRPELSGRDNAMLGGMLLGMPRLEIKKLIPEIESFADIGEFFDQPVASYSTGMRARLGFAVAIHADPDVLLIDEVLGVGDQNFKMKSSKAMREKIESNKTVVLVSHSLESIAELCDRVMWIEKGRLIAIGDTDRILNGYRDAIKLAVKEMQAKERAEAALARGSALDSV